MNEDFVVEVFAGLFARGRGGSEDDVGSRMATTLRDFEKCRKELDSARRALLIEGDDMTDFVQDVAFGNADGSDVNNRIDAMRNMVGALEDYRDALLDRAKSLVEQMLEVAMGGGQLGEIAACYAGRAIKQLQGVLRGN